MKNRINLFIGFVIFFLVVGCANYKLPKTLGEQYSNFTYIPIDPLPVSDEIGNSCFDFDSTDRKVRNSKDLKPFRSAFPDQTARLAISQTDVNGNISYGPAGAKTKNSRFKVTFDYAASDVTNVRMEVLRIVTLPNKEQNDLLKEKYQSPEYNSEKKSYHTNDTISVYNKIFDGQSKYELSKMEYDSVEGVWTKRYDNSTVVTFPVYVGFGVRLTADLTATENKVDVSGLGAISAGVEAGKVSGTMVMQSLGITGEAVRHNFPIQSEINQATIQNALIAIGSIKSIVDDTVRTFIEPRVLGFYNPIGGGTEVINRVISELAKEPLIWYRPCEN